MKSSDVDIPWADLKLVLAIDHAGSFRRAAEALNMSHPTVSRRIAELQADLGVHLFERDGRRLKLTAAGQDLAQTAARIQQEVDSLGRRIAGRDHRLEGLVRVAVSPSMGAALAPALPAFSDRHPGIRLEFVNALGMANLTRREADVAIRQTQSPHETLVGRKLSQFEQALYVHRDYLRGQLAAGNSGPMQWSWIDWDEAHSHHASARWISTHVDKAQVRYRCDTSLAMYHLVKSRAGVGFVPTMLAGPDPDLLEVQVAEEQPYFRRTIWVLTHADLRDTGRVRATVEWLNELLFVEGSGVWPGLAAAPRP